MWSLKCLAAVVLAPEAFASVGHHHHHHKHGHHGAAGGDAVVGAVRGHHHRHHHHRHDGEPRGAEASLASNASAPTSAAAAGPAAVPAEAPKGAAPHAPAPPKEASDAEIMSKMKHLESELAAKEKAAANLTLRKGQLSVNGPLPVGFSASFAAAVAEATGCASGDVRVVGSVPAPEAGLRVDDIMFEAKGSVVDDVEKQAADPGSKLATGPLHSFLVAREDDEDDDDDKDKTEAKSDDKSEREGPDTDTSGAMPYGDLEPFGREDTAQELTESSIKESDAMVDQLERAEVAEEKRAVFRALTRLRGAAITSYDGIARAQTGNIDEYAQKNKWRAAHDVRHLAEDESDVNKWAFPSNADF